MNQFGVNLQSCRKEASSMPDGCREVLGLLNSDH